MTANRVELPRSTKLSCHLFGTVFPLLHRFIGKGSTLSSKHMALSTQTNVGTCHIAHSYFFPVPLQRNGEQQCWEWQQLRLASTNLDIESSWQTLMVSVWKLDLPVVEEQHAPLALRCINQPHAAPALRTHRGYLPVWINGSSAIVTFCPVWLDNGRHSTIPPSRQMVKSNQTDRIREVQWQKAMLNAT